MDRHIHEYKWNRKYETEIDSSKNAQLIFDKSEKAIKER
jgi:hypothetical protein